MPLLSDSLRNLAASLTVAALLIAALVLGRDILVPLIIAVLLAFVLSPIVRALTAIRVPRGVAVTAVIFILVGALVGFSYMLSTQLLTLTADLASYRTNVIDKVRAVTGAGTGDGAIAKAAKAVDSLGDAIDKEINAPAENSAPSSQRSIDPQTIIVKQEAAAERKVGLLDYAPAFGQPLAQSALTVLFAMFLLLQYQDLRDRVVRVVGTAHMSDTTSAMSEAGDKLSQLFLMQAILNSAFGIAVGLALWFIGIPNAPLWGVLSAVMRFVPYVGSVLAAIPPLLLAAAVDPGWGMLISTLAVFLIGEPLMGHVIEPLVLGKKAGISPFAMIASASFWTIIWGPIGLILAAPLTMTLVVLGRYVTGLEFFSVLLGDEPALSPEEQFYHRLLSDDSISASQKFETALERNPIADVTDTLVLPGLRFAAIDHRRGRLDREQALQLAETTAHLRERITDLEDIDPEKQAGKGEAKILILAGRGPIDSAAAAFIASVLQSTLASSISVITELSGLTALSSARAQQKKDPVDVLIVATVGGMEQQQLQFLIKRAEKEFSTAQVVGFDFHPPGDHELMTAKDQNSKRPSRSVRELLSMIRNIYTSAAVTPSAKPLLAAL